jgi:type IV pilus assembly protein PilZ
MPTEEARSSGSVVIMTVKDRPSGKAPDEPERKASPDERREHERVMVDIEVDYSANDTFLFAYITDLSAMGIFIQTNDPAPPGTHLNLRFRGLSGQLLELEGEVIWVNPHRPDDSEGRNPGMGVRFCDLELWHREELLRMVHTFAYLDDDSDDETARLSRS